LNPALIGDYEDVTMSISYRSQYRSLVFPYNTSQVSFIAPFYKNKHRRPEGHIGGLGASVYTDEAGEGKNFKSTGANVSFGYNLQLATDNINRFTFALQTGIINKRINTDVLEWGEQYNDLIGFDPNVVPADVELIRNSTVLDITAGVFWRYYSSVDSRKIRSAYAGLSTSHLNHPDQSVLEGQKDNLPLLHKLHGGVVFALSEKFTLSGNLLSQIQDKENQTNFGAFAAYKLPVNSTGILTNMVTRVGTWYRWKDSFIASVEFLTDNLQFGFSYDWNVTSLKYNNRGTGAYEFTMGYKFFKPAPPKILY
jgi:type IX secretion system PorP/SprF family membrane protein